MALTVHIKHVKVQSVFHFKLSFQGINFLPKFGSQECEKHVLVAPHLLFMTWAVVSVLLMVNVTKYFFDLSKDSVGRLTNCF